MLLLLPVDLADGRVTDDQHCISTGSSSSSHGDGGQGGVPHPVHVEAHEGLVICLIILESLGCCHLAVRCCDRRGVRGSSVCHVHLLGVEVIDGNVRVAGFKRRRNVHGRHGVERAVQLVHEVVEAGMAGWLHMLIDENEVLEAVVVLVRGPGPPVPDMNVLVAVLNDLELVVELITKSNEDGARPVCRGNASKRLVGVQVMPEDVLKEESGGDTHDVL